MMAVQVSWFYHLVMCSPLVAVMVLTNACDTWPGGLGGGEAEPTIAMIYVDANRGSDAGDGSPESPFRTITIGLSGAQEHYTVTVAPGTYDETIGEMFPIQLEQNVAVEGDINNKGKGSPPTIINGAGNYTSPSLADTYNVAVVCAAGAVLRGFTITAADGTAIWCEGDSTNVTISENTISASDYGVLVTGTAEPVIKNNVISDNDISGIETLISSAPKIRGTTIANNSFGIRIRGTSQPDLGTATDFGANNLTNNANCDLHNQTPNKISAIGNVWDDDPFLFTASDSCSDGANISNYPGGAVDYQYVPFDNLLFPASSKITSIIPEKGAMILTNEPRFEWIPTGNRLVFLGLFNKPIVVRNNTIVNEADLIWAWHSGLDRGRDGDVKFYDGVNAVDGELNNATLPIPLEKGRSYYWGVWAWDEDGVEITHSSVEFYFTIAN